MLVRRLIVESLSPRRVLASVSGTVFEDVDGSMHRNNSEAGLISRVVYIDGNSNSQLDLNERIAITNSSGQFEFTNLVDGQYKIAVYNGTDSQIQTAPVRSNNILVVDELTSAVKLLQPDGSLVRTDSSIVSIDLTTGETVSTLLPTSLSDAAVIPNGQVLATLGGSSLAVTALLVDPVGQTQSTIDLNGGQIAEDGFSTIAIDNEGYGLLLESGDSGLVPIRHIDASDPENIQVTVTSTQVAPNTEIHLSPAGTRTLLALPTIGGYAVSLWSNATGTLITPSPISIESSVSVAAFDDAAGLLAMRTDTGSLKFYDVDANFSPLYEINQDAGPIFIDAARDRVLALSAEDSLLSVFDSETGSLATQVALNVATVGSKLQVVVGEAADTVVTLGGTGLVRSKLNQPESYTATIAGNVNFDTVQIGMRLVGTNTAPQYTTVPTFTTPEDVSLVKPAPAAKVESQDADGDQYIVIRRGQAQNGTASLNYAGRLSYVPDLDFNGQDSVAVWLHDGRDHSPETDLPIDVTPVADPPTAIDVSIDPVPENLPIDQPFGVIDIIDVDGINHVILVDDPRFRVINGQIVLVAGPLNYELEQLIPITISATDNETNETVSVNTTITVRDANDPITGITPTSASVPENRPGEFIAELEVVDEDSEQFYVLTTDDPRFIVDNFDLRLANGVSLNYEAGQTITFTVTATEFEGDFSFDQEFTIHVVDVPEQPNGISITGSSVRELVPGDVVGNVLLDNFQPNSRFVLTTDDSRFEIDGNVLKLVDSSILQRNDGAQVLLTISATDSQNQFATIEQDFRIDVLANDYPSHNVDNPFDVNQSGTAESTDALAIINYLRVHGPGPVGTGESLARFYDVNGDGVITALDALLVINHLRRRSTRTSSGEDVAPSQSPDSSRQSIALEQPRSNLVAVQPNNLTLAPVRTIASKIISTAPNQSAVAQTVQLPKPDEIDKAFAQDSDDEDWRLV